MRGEKGFTLIEMVIVVAIFGILLAIAAISASVWIPRYNVESQTKQLYSDLMNARVSAMERNRMFFVTLLPANTANQYSIYEDNWPSPDGNEQQDPQDRLVTQTTVKYLLVSNPTTTSFSFAGSGMASAATDIWCKSTANPATDCIGLAPTRILMGKWNGTTNTCTVQ